MLCPLADNAARAVPAVSSDDATPAVGSLRVPLKPGPKPRFSQEQKRARHVLASRADRKRKKEAHAALEIRAQKAEDELKSARTKISQLVACLTFATSENIKLRAQLEGREVDEMVAELQAQIPRADLQGEGAVV